MKGLRKYSIKHIFTRIDNVKGKSLV